VKFQNDVENLLTRTVDDIMNKNGWKKSRGNYYPKAKGWDKSIRFFLKNTHLSNGKISLILELRGKLATKELGNAMIDEIKKKWNYEEKPSVGENEKNAKKGYYHIGLMWNRSFAQPPEGISVIDNLTTMIQTAFFTIPEGETLNFTAFCMNELAELQKD
jgi:hypothetical protein